MFQCHRRGSNGFGLGKSNSHKTGIYFRIIYDTVIPFVFHQVSSVKTWYYPTLTRFDLYRAVVDLLPDREESEIREDEIYYDGCITWKIGDGAFSTTGFNGQAKEYEAKLLSPNFEAYEFWPKDGTSIKFHFCLKINVHQNNA